MSAFVKMLKILTQITIGLIFENAFPIVMLWFFSRKTVVSFNKKVLATKEVYNVVKESLTTLLKEIKGGQRVFCR